MPAVVETSSPILALLKNKTLTNAKTWKQLQSLLNVLSGVAPFLMFVMPSLKPLLTPEFLSALMGAVATMNAYFTTATTGKLGV